MTAINTFLNGEFTLANVATVNIEDRGLLFGDGIYEYVRCYFGKVFQLDRHLKRFANSAAAIHLEIPYSPAEITSLVAKLLRKSGFYGEAGFSDAGVYIQVTRGAAPRTHNFPKKIKENFFMIARPLDKEPPSIMDTGVKAILVTDERWGRCDIKSLNLLANVLAKEKAVQQNAYEAIFYKDNKIMEASSSSFFAVFNGELFTTPQGPWILPGITRDIVVELARQEGIPVKFEFVSKKDLFNADEVFVTSSSWDIVPVTQIDDRKVSNGKPGPVAIRLKKSFADFAKQA